MQFDLHPWKYRVRVCPGPLSRDGTEVAALVHRREILIAGDIDPGDRLDALLDQLSRLREKHHGKLDRRGVAGFTADVMRQLQQQGGVPALQRLGADGLVDAGGTDALSAEPVGCECGTCGTRYGPHQITTAGAEFDTGSGKLVVQRSVDCDFCGHTMSWTEGATGAGHPNGRVMGGPFYTRGGVTSAASASE